MLAGHPQIVLFRPEIPQNAGSIARLAAATQCRLHLIKPFGFSADDKHLRRAGLDYWPYLDLEIHDDIEPLLQRFPLRVAFFSKKATQNYLELPMSTDLLVFGQETCGLPDQLFRKHPKAFYKIALFHDKVRSLNLANAVAVVVYELMRKKNLLTSGP